MILQTEVLRTYCFVPMKGFIALHDKPPASKLNINHKLLIVLLRYLSSTAVSCRRSQRMFLLFCFFTWVTDRPTNTCMFGTTRVKYTCRTEQGKARKRYRMPLLNVLHRTYNTKQTRVRSDLDQSHTVEFTLPYCP